METTVSSKEFKLTKENMVSLFKGLLVAIVGASLAYTTQFVTKTDFGTYTPLVVAVFSVAANAVRLWMAEK